VRASASSAIAPSASAAGASPLSSSTSSAGTAAVSFIRPAASAAAPRTGASNTLSDSITSAGSPIDFENARSAAARTAPLR
jgi:hypothetical protein